MTNINLSNFISSPVSYLFKTANYLAQDKDYIMTDTSGGTFTITLPASPSIGDSVTLYDNASWTANNLTVARNGSTIEGIADNFSLDISSIKVEFIYNSATWQVYASSGPPGPTGPVGEGTSISTAAALAITLG